MSYACVCAVADANRRECLQGTSKKKPHQLSLAGLRVTPIRGYFSAASFSFSLAITVSATLAGQPA